MNTIGILLASALFDSLFLSVLMLFTASIWLLATIHRPFKRTAPRWQVIAVWALLVASLLALGALALLRGVS